MWLTLKSGVEIAESPQSYCHLGIAWMIFVSKHRAALMILVASAWSGCEGRLGIEPAYDGDAMAASAAYEVLKFVPSGGYVAVEALRKDLENIRENAPNCFIWPKVCSSNATAFVDGAGEREPLQALQLDPGTYDIALSYVVAGGDEASSWRGKLTDIRVDSAGAVLEAATTSPDGRGTAVFALRLQAHADPRPDESICAADRSALVECTPDSQHFRCAYGGFAVYGCSKARMYEDLKQQLCGNQQDMKESEFAAGFSCSEIASADIPLPL